MKGFKQALMELVQKKGRSKMAATEQQRKRNNYFSYAYGQIYAGYLKSGKAETFKVTNVAVREWRGILGWLKKKQYIVDFKLGNTVETAAELEVTGFNDEDKMFEKYLEAIERNVLAEQPKKRETAEAGGACGEQDPECRLMPASKKRGRKSKKTA